MKLKALNEYKISKEYGGTQRIVYMLAEDIDHVIAYHKNNWPDAKLLSIEHIHRVNICPQGDN